MAFYLDPRGWNPLQFILILLGIVVILWRIHRDMKKRTGRGLF